MMTIPAVNHSMQFPGSFAIFESMFRLIVNVRNREEEAALLDFLLKRNYEYAIEHGDWEPSPEQLAEWDKRYEEFQEGKMESLSWEEVKKKLNRS